MIEIVPARLRQAEDYDISVDTTLTACESDVSLRGQAN